MAAPSPSRSWTPNGDGVDDIVAASYTDQWTGQTTYLHTGPISTDDVEDGDAQLVATDPSSGFATQLDAAGDNNGDGYDDLLIHATQDDTGGLNAGALYLVHGPWTGGNVDSLAAAKIYNDLAWSTGEVRAAAGDVNGDGADELVLASGATGIRTVLVLDDGLAGTVGYSAYSARITGAQGTGPSGAVALGDGTGDGSADLLVGANADNRVFLFTGGAE